jgi:hypothetical protein
MIWIVLLVAPFWVGAYIVAGWTGVAAMALLGVIGELVILAYDEIGWRRQRRIARDRWEGWNR